jgi:hypothetical protein
LTASLVSSYFPNYPKTGAAFQIVEAFYTIGRPAWPQIRRIFPPELPDAGLSG